MNAILEKLHLTKEEMGAHTGSPVNCSGGILPVVSPINGRSVGKIRQAGVDDFEIVVQRSVRAFSEWRMVPAPKRGEIIRRIGNAFRKQKKDLASLVTLEVGKIRAESEGEIQEAIDIADFATGQSRMLYGLTMPSERPGHRMFEQWHPLGPVGVITAFNFPVAVWAWNAFIALAAGDTVIWKPSSKASLTAIAAMKTACRVLRENDAPEGVMSLVIGDRSDIGEALIADRRIPLISATGSVRMGRHIAERVAGRLGKTILELGGNNAAIVTPSADPDLAVRSILFGVVGTAGQRCTTTRRLIVHKDIFEIFSEALVYAFKQIRVGDPMKKGTMMGPLIDRDAARKMQVALKLLKEQGGRIRYGGEILSGGIFDAGAYVSPCICEAPPDSGIVFEETFAPILYMIRYEHMEEAIRYHNQVSQGLSSAIFTTDIRESEFFLSHQGSDCGIANVNAGTSGAE
ncbi:MAG: aldehyde dehydrogenase, partial [Deltaproteobacteria bacterium RBG_13_49_15]